MIIRLQSYDFIMLIATVYFGYLLGVALECAANYASLGNYDIHRLVVGVDFNVVDNLTVECHPDLNCRRPRKQAVVVAASASYAITFIVECYGWHYDKVNLLEWSYFVALRFFDVESSELQCRFVVGEDVEVYTVYSGKEKLFFQIPFSEKSECGKFIGQ